MPVCRAQHLKRARKSTKKIDSQDDLEGFGHLHENDQRKVSGFIEGMLCSLLSTTDHCCGASGEAFAKGEDIENPYPEEGAAQPGGQKADTKKGEKKKKKSSAPEPVIPGHVLEKAKAKKQTSKNATTATKTETAKKEKNTKTIEGRLSSCLLCGCFLSVSSDLK